MTWYAIALLVIIFGLAGMLWYQVYGMVKLDAKSRGLKRPRLWGYFASSADSGLLLYLLGRRNYVSTMNEADQAEMEGRKKQALWLVVLLVAATVLLLAAMML